MLTYTYTDDYLPYSKKMWYINVCSDTENWIVYQMWNIHTFQNPTTNFFGRKNQTHLPINIGFPYLIYSNFLKL